MVRIRGVLSGVYAGVLFILLLSACPAGLGGEAAVGEWGEKIRSEGHAHEAQHSSAPDSDVVLQFFGSGWRLSDDALLRVAREIFICLSDSGLVLAYQSLYTPYLQTASCKLL